MRAFGPVVVQVQIDCVVSVKVGTQQKSATIALDFDVGFPAVARSSRRSFDEVLSMWMDKLPPCEVASAGAVPVSYAPHSFDNLARRAVQADKLHAEQAKLEALLSEPKRYEEAQAASAEAKRKALLAARAKQQAADRRKFLAQHPVLSTGAELVFIGADRKCAVQFVEAAAMEGLEKRKRLADLVAHGCGFTASSMVHVRVAEKQGGYALVEVLEGDNQGKSGWVPSGWLR
jgi:hypothetical protein